MSSAEVINFLKMYTPVSEAFINDFYGIVDPSVRKTDHVVCAAVAAKWLGMTKGNLVRSLRTHGFVEDVDFVIRKGPVPEKRKNSRPTKDVLLTTECFKGICMMVNTQRSKQARSYYIAVEDTLLRYRREIEDSLRRRILQLERNQKTRSAATAAQGGAPGVVYVIRAAAGTKTVFKLGRTRDLHKRLQSHHSALADGLEIVFVFQTSMMEQVEACAKAVLKTVQYRKYKEIYQTDLDSIKRIITGCEELAKGVPALQGGGDDRKTDHFLVLHSGDIQEQAT